MTTCVTMSVYTSLVTLICLLLYTVEQIHASPIWRCPDFKLLPCKTLPSTCTSFRMIYIRHVHMECPACLICADPWELKPWTMFGTDSSSSPSVPKRHKKRRERKQERRQEKLVARQQQSAARSEEKEKREALRQMRKLENRHRKRRRRRQEKLLERERKSAARLEEKEKRRETRRLRRLGLKEGGTKTILSN